MMIDNRQLSEVKASLRYVLENNKEIVTNDNVDAYSDVLSLYKSVALMMLMDDDDSLENEYSAIIQSALSVVGVLNKVRFTAGVDERDQKMVSDAVKAMDRILAFVMIRQLELDSSPRSVGVFDDVDDTDGVEGGGAV